MNALDFSRGQQCSICERGGDLELLLVFSEQDVEGPSKAPHGEHQEQQKPLHISHRWPQSVQKGVLGQVEYTAKNVHREAAGHTTSDVASADAYTNGAHACGM